MGLKMMTSLDREVEKATSQVDIHTNNRTDTRMMAALSYRDVL